ncbi:MAG: hypothetical protein HC837_01875 [Chloroflexaceae bacterium]|nr:hypothetical protein [Chloroflexaceae bacterium]
MSTYPVHELLRMWRSESLGVDQAVGHTLQHISLLCDQTTRLEHQQARFEQHGSALEQQIIHLEQQVASIMQRLVALEQTPSGGDSPPPRRRQKPR